MINSSAPVSASSRRLASGEAGRNSQASGDRRFSDESRFKLLRSVQAFALGSLKDRLDHMFDGADDLLFDMAKAAASNSEQRTLFDTMRVIRLDRLKIAQAFLDTVGSGFSLGTNQGSRPADDQFGALDNLGLQEVQTLERSIAICNMATKAEGQYKTLIWEVEGRLSKLIESSNPLLSPKLISPVAICDAFGRSTEKLDCEFAISLVVYKLFDRLVMGHLGDMYSGVIALLKEQGIDADRAVLRNPDSLQPEQDFSFPEDTQAQDNAGFAHAQAYDNSSVWQTQAPQYSVPQYAGRQYADSFQGRAASTRGATGHASSGAATGAGPFGTAHTTPPRRRAVAGLSQGEVDPRTLDVLSRLGQFQSTAEAGPYAAGPYTDYRLAGDLASAALGNAVPGWEEPQAMAYIQRAGAVGEMFNQILADPNVPGALKPQFDDLRFTVIKTALQDVSFFANPKHPVRGLLNELGELATTARAASPDVLARVRQLVSQIQGQFDVAAESVRNPSAGLEPLKAKQITDFLAQQAAQNAERRKALVAKARRVVSEELHLRTLGRKIPAQALTVLNSGWGPMQGMRLMRHGADTAEWSQGLDLLDRVVSAVDPVSEDDRDAGARVSLIHDLREGFRGVGMKDSRISELLDKLGDAFRQLDSGVETPVAAESVRVEAPAKEGGFKAIAAAGETEIVDDNSPIPSSLKLMVSAALAPGAQTRESGIDPTAILNLLIVPGAWFHVYDHQQLDFRWLKAIAHYPNRDVVAFAEFNGKNTLFMKTQQFFDDLSDGLVRPLDLSPMTRRAVDVFLSSNGDYVARSGLQRPTSASVTAAAA